jgi:hypothetical protein
MFQISGFGFRVSGFGFRVPGSGFRVSGFGSRVPGFGFRVEGLPERQTKRHDHDAVHEDLPPGRVEPPVLQILPPDGTWSRVQDSETPMLQILPPGSGVFISHNELMKWF